MKRLIVFLTVLTLTTATVSALVIIPLNSRGWTTFGIQPVPLINVGDGSLTFDFPTVESANNIGYLYTTKVPKLPKVLTTLSMMMRVDTVGPVVFDFHTEPWTTGTAPSTARPYSENNRWWSNPTAYVLAPGSAYLSVPLTPDAWSNVNGKFGTYDAVTLAGWNDAISHITAVGLTFGGGDFYSHGVFVTGGTATFSLLDYRLE